MRPALTFECTIGFFSTTLDNSTAMLPGVVVVLLLALSSSAPASHTSAKWVRAHWATQATE